MRFLLGELPTAVFGAIVIGAAAPLLRFAAVWRPHHLDAVGRLGITAALSLRSVLAE